MNVHTILLVLALVCFIAAGLGVAVGRLNLVAAGLALWVLSLLL
jgi:hypothetical protein